MSLFLLNSKKCEYQLFEKVTSNEHNKHGPKLGGSGEKSSSKDMKNFFFHFSNLSQSVFVLEN